MTASPSPFEVAKQISNNLGQSVERQGDISALDKILSNVSAEGTDEELNNAMAQIVQRVSPARQKAAVGVLQDRRTQILKQKRNKAFKAQGFSDEFADLPENIQREIIRGDAKKESATAQITPFKKARATLQAKQFTEAEDQKAKLQGTFDNIGRLKELKKDLKGPLGSAKAFLKTGKAAEFNAVGFSAIEPILKIFNPTGPIPVAKVKIIEERFAPKASDLSTTIDGKIKALESLAQQTLDRAQKRIDLMTAFDGEPPSNVIQQFDADSSRLLDQIVNNETQKITQVEGDTQQGFASLPPPEQFAGQTITDNQTGQKFRSDGKKWERIK